MKKFRFIYRSMVISFVIILNACQLAEEIEDYEPKFSLPGEEAIRDQESAELALIGIYAGFNGGEISNMILAAPSVMYGSGISPRNTPEIDGWAENRPSVENTDFTLAGYSQLYSTINKCNWVIEGVSGNLTDSDFSTPNRRLEIIGEAKAMRATCYYYLLGLFGEFYNLNSEYGVTLRLTPPESDEAFPRNTVAEVYNSIEIDLEDAMLNAPETNEKFFINRSYAKSFLARIKLYQGLYDEAMILAEEIINSGGAQFQLSPTYEEIFDNTSPALYQTSELLFASRNERQYTLGMSPVWNVFVAGNPAFIEFATSSTININGQVINYDSNRVSSQFVPGIFGLGNAKYPDLFIPTESDAIYHMRMAEVYLILAEAEARANNGVTTKALEALNAVRLRAGATSSGDDGFEVYPSTITLVQFLEAVRVEKVVELFGEVGQEWFDLVRFAYIDGGFDSNFQVSDIKPEAENPNFYILPIPPVAIEAGGNIVKQNPGY